MSENQVKDTVAEDAEAAYLDFADPKVVRKALKEAFDTWVPSQGSFVGPKLAPGRSPAPYRRKRVEKVRTLPQSKFCFDRCTKILTYIGLGMYLPQVCQLAGLSEKIFGEWVAKGRAATEGPYYVFARAFEQIAASFEARQVANINNLAFGKDGSGRRHMPATESAKLSLRLLQVKFPKRWGEKIDVTSDGKPIASERPSKIELAFVDASSATPVSAGLAKATEEPSEE
jgi:hypothetical protein